MGFFVVPVSFFNSREDRNLASFGLSADGHENKETNLLLACAGEARKLPIRFLISDFMTFFFLSRECQFLSLRELKETDRNSEKIQTV